MKILHKKIQELKERTAGEYLICRYVDNGTDFTIRLQTIPDNPWKDNPRVIRGYLAVWGVPDTYGTVAIRGCFSKSLKDRGPESGAKNKIIHLWIHDMKEPVGSYLELVEDDYGLRFACLVDDVAGTPERVLKQTKSGTLNQYSYGFNYVWDKMEYNETRKVIEMYECDLYEGSSLSIKASNPETYTIRSKEDLTKALLELGNEAEDVIESLPRNARLEVRQLISRYKSLAENKPLEKRMALDLSGEPSNKKELVVGTYKLNLNSF
jgi:HK97 family phage prohead protease